MKRIELHEVLAYMKPELLKVEQVAERLQVNRRTVQSWIDSGDLLAIDVRPTGATRALWRIEAADLMAFIMARKLLG
jgi:excisionase family DNA binding protein